MTYDYECPDCGHIQEEVHSADEMPNIKCERCRVVMQRVITGGTGFSLKGSDWCSTGVANIIKRKT